MKEKEAFQKSLGSSSVISIWKVAQSAEEHLCALGVLWPKEFNDRVGTELSLAAADEGELKGLSLTYLEEMVVHLEVTTDCPCSNNGWGECLQAPTSKMSDYWFVSNLCKLTC